MARDPRYDILFGPARLVDVGVNVGVDIVLNRALTSIEQGRVTSECGYSGRTNSMTAGAVVMVASRRANDDIWQQLGERESQWEAHGKKSIKVIGDARGLPRRSPGRPMPATVMRANWMDLTLVMHYPFDAKWLNSKMTDYMLLIKHD